jgi:hypothetical protein
VTRVSSNRFWQLSSGTSIRDGNCLLGGRWVGGRF